MKTCIKSLLVLVVMMIAFSSTGKDFYTTPAEQKALRSAYDIVRACYSDSIHICAASKIKIRGNLQMFIPLDSLGQYYKYYASVRDSIDSSNLCKVLAADTCKCENYKYIVEFEIPYHNMLSCEVAPYTRRDPYMYSGELFVFKYNEIGVIYEVKRGSIHYCY